MTGLTVAVVCRACKGTGDGEDGYCGWCQAQGHEHINRAPDGSVPALHDTGEPVVEWIPPMLPDAAPNPLTLTYQRCVP